MYEFFAQPVALATFAEPLLEFAGRFSLVVGCSNFGDLFLRDPELGEFAILVVSTVELVDTGEVTEVGFRQQLLTNAEVVRTLLRPDAASTIAERIGNLQPGEVFIPVPHPSIGGSGALSSFEKGGVREYVSWLIQFTNDVD